MFTHYTVAARRYLLRGAIALGTIIVLFGSWCEGRSLFFTQASISVQSSQCLVFGVRGDRFFILGDRSSKTRKGDRYLCKHCTV
ncbi:hypothetical protein [Microcoleus sp. OTE_8_concoct_300]|uniref:hypothetical protein n=1 Tax=Microcoleus sp. OTE_8_concoct_300 TaxID=2964710 RepID=UPI00403F68BD